MDLGKLTIFNVIKKRMAWTAQRQEVLAHNIANANTPDFGARDLKPFAFKDIVKRESMKINMAMTGPNHLTGRVTTIRDISEHEIRNPYETSPNGNSVILEEQMSKMNETSISHKLTNELYSKQMAMFKIALTGRK